jgi:myo-inositol-1(or 4)-monophosphatase
MLPDLEQLRAVVLPVARQELLPRFTRIAAALKSDGSIVTEADLACQQALAAALAAQWPQIPLLGEEMDAGEQQRLLDDAEAGLWCLDPLDGTSNFAAGIPYFAVALAYIRHGAVQLGLVYDPVRDECFSAARGRGAWCNGVALQSRATGLPLSRCVAMVDFKRLAPALATRLVCTTPFASQRNFGSSALDWCMLAAGRGHLYLHGRQNLWDYAAGSLILAEAGGCAATLQGEPVLQVGLQPRSVVATLDPALFGPWREWIATAGG